MSSEGPSADMEDPSRPARSGTGAERSAARRVRAEAALATDAVRRLLETCHDMRQPTASVLALAGAALSEPGIPGTVRVSLEEIIREAEQLADMIQDWLRAEVGSSGWAG